MSNDDIRQLIKSRQYDKLYEAISTNSNSNLEKECYNSPLNISEETKIFHKIINYLLQKKEHSEILICEDNQVYINFDDHQYQLSDLIKKVNFNHLYFNMEDTNQYISQIISIFHNSGMNNNVTCINMPHFFEKSNNAAKSLNLDYAEMFALYLYTFTLPTNLLFTEDAMERAITIATVPANSFIASLLMTTAIASSALNKTLEHSIELPYVFRYDSQIGCRLSLEDCKNNVTNSTVTTWQAFMSTTLNHHSLQIGSIYRDYIMILKNVKGKEITSIARSDEQEYLIPPSTQLKWTGYTQLDNQHIFTLEGVNILDEDNTNILGEDSI